MYGAQLPTTGFSVLIYAVVGAVTATAGLIMKMRGKK